MKHELVRLAEAIDGDWIDDELADLFSDTGRPAIATRYMTGLSLLKHIYGLSDDRRVRTLTPRRLLPVLHRRGVLPARPAARAFRHDPLAP